MKKILLLILFYAGSLHFVFSQDVRKLSELAVQGSIVYYNGIPYTGEAIDFDGNKFDKSKLKFDGHYLNGKPTGHIKKWYSNRQLESDENYGADGFKQGLQVYYYETGKVKEKQNFRDGREDGIQTQWNPNGKKTSEKYYSNGVPDGKWKNYDGFDKIVSETEYQNGKIVSEVLYNNGNKSSEKYYSNGTPEGKWRNYDENNQLTSETIYDKGIVVSEKSYTKNIPDGIWETRDGNRLTEIVYSNGTVKSESNYLNNVLDGKQTEYIDSAKTKEVVYQNGQKLSEGNWLNNKQDGRWTYWLDNGQQMAIKIYDHGQLIKEEEPKFVAYLISNYKPSDNSFLLKIDNYEKPFIRVDLMLNNQQQDPYVKKVVEVIRNKFLYPSDRLSKVFPDGPYKDESINYIIEITSVDIRFDNCTYTVSNYRRYGYVSTIDISASIKSTDGKISYSKILRFTPKVLFLVVCSQSKDLAFNTAYSEIEKNFIKTLIDKNFPVKKK